MKPNPNAIDRRQFIKLALASSSALLAMGFLREEIQPPTDEQKGSKIPSWAMVIDLAACIGCGDCVLACQAHNDMPSAMIWNRISPDGSPVGEVKPLPTQCMHCDHAPCVNACPVKATYKRPDGIVMMDYDRCIGCRYCQVACPYGARFFNWEEYTDENPSVPEYGHPEVARRPRGVVEKCTFCVQRIDRGLAAGLTPGVDRRATPACVNACPMKARTFGNLNDPDSPVRKVLAGRPAFRLREASGTEPRIYYLPADSADENSRRTL